MNRASSASGSGGVVAALLLALSAAVAPMRAGASAQSPAASSTHAAHGRAALSGLDRRIALLSRAFGLDAWQQAALRKVLTDEHEEERRIWSERALPSASRIAATRALSRHTADRIRALLNAEQRNRYDPAPPQAPAQAVADAHVEDWLTRKNGERGPRTAVVAGVVQDGR